MKTFSIILLFLLISAVEAQTTAIPDVNFEQKLIDLGFDYGSPDGVILTSSIDTVTNLDVKNSFISDLTGIEDFIALELLISSQNQLTNINISQNTLLTYFDCMGNQLTNIDLSQNVGLLKLYCSSNSLISLDISNNILLEHLYCGGNNLTSLDVSQNTALLHLNCSFNQLSNLNVSQDTSLTRIICDFNQITGLDVSQNN